MMAKQIKITVRHGKPTIETSGFEGTSCLDATRNVEELLSGDGGVEVRDVNGEVVVNKQTVRA
jgi:hypothetical protein